MFVVYNLFYRWDVIPVLSMKYCRCMCVGQLSESKKERNTCAAGPWQEVSPQATERAGGSVTASHSRGLTLVVVGSAQLTNTNFGNHFTIQSPA